MREGGLEINGCEIMAEAVVGCEEDEGGQLPRRRSCGSMIRVELTMMVVYTMRKNKTKWENLAHEAIVIPNRLSLPDIPPEMLLNFRFQLGVTPPSIGLRIRASIFRAAVINNAECGADTI